VDNSAYSARQFSNPAPHSGRCPGARHDVQNDLRPVAFNRSRFKGRRVLSSANAGGYYTVVTVVASILDDPRPRGDVHGRDIANIVDVISPDGSPSQHTQAVIADSRYVRERLSVSYTEDEMRRWLHARHHLLNGTRAIDLIVAGRAEEVLAVIDRLDAGAYI
jgi:Protein of unknown function (DUF2384)